MNAGDGDSEEDKTSPVGRGHSMVADMCSAGAHGPNNLHFSS